MSSGQSSHQDISQSSTQHNGQTGMNEQDVQPESGTIREDDIRQSSPASERVNDKNMEAPEEA